MPLDVAIVGAGPAGSWAARMLATAGARVTIFDASHPREKPCGGGLTGRALALLHPALDGLDSIVVAESATFEADSSRLSSTVPLAHHGFTAQSALVIVSRAVFDRRLLDEAEACGARLVTERVTDVSVDSGSVLISTMKRKHRASFVIGADGAASLVRRKLATPFGRAQVSIATGYFVRGVTSRAIAIHCVSKPAGYIWSFPRTDHLAVGICAQAHAVANSQPLRALVKRWLERSVREEAAELEPYSWPIPSLSSNALASNVVAGPRWLLIGDAAGLVDSLTREGIYYALRSAELAAGSILDDDRRAPFSYRQRLESEIYPELRRASGVMAQFFTPAFSSLLIEALSASPAIRRVAADLVAGRQSYHGLRRRLLATGEFGLAARLAGSRLKAIWQGTRRAPAPSPPDDRP